MERSRGHGPANLLELVRKAEEQGVEYDQVTMDTVSESTSAQMETGEQSKRQYYKEFKKVVEAADVILEILDARDPMGCRSAAVEHAVAAAGARKKLVLVLNKVDLVPRENVEQWLKLLREEHPAIAFRSSTQQQQKNLAEAQGTNTLMMLLANYSRNLGLKTAIRVGVVGYPNVGKSSIINSLKRSKVCGTSATAGYTKVTQEVVLDKHIKLIDCPGIVFAHNPAAAADLTLRNCVNVEKIHDPLPAVELILQRCNHEQLMEKYVIPQFSGTVEFLQHLARRLGKLKKGGIPDCDTAARLLLQDWNTGKISYYTIPPAKMQQPAHVASAIVSSWGAEFDMAALLKEEEETVLPSLMRQRDCGGFFTMSGLSHVAPDVMIHEEAVTMDIADREFVTTQKKAKAKKAPEEEEDEEMVDLNMRKNKSIKASQKQQQKDVRKGKAVATLPSVADDDFDTDAPYDFTHDFVAVSEYTVEKNDDEEDDDDDEEDDDDEDGVVSGEEDEEDDDDDDYEEEDL